MVSEKIESKQSEKVKLPWFISLSAFIYTVLIWVMSYGWLKFVLVAYFHVNISSASTIAFFISAIIAGVGNRGVKAIYRLKHNS